MTTHDSQRTSPIGFLFLRLPPPPCAVHTGTENPPTPLWRWRRAYWGFLDARAFETMRNMQILVFWTDFYGDKTCRLPCFLREVLYIYCENNVLEGFLVLESIWNSLAWEAPTGGKIWNSLAWEAPTGGKVKKTPLGSILGGGIYMCDDPK